MTLKCLCMLLFGLKMMMIVSTCAQSAANILFLNTDGVPLFDVYIKSASHVSTREIVTVPTINDSKQDWKKNGTLLPTINDVFYLFLDDQLMYQKYMDDELQTLLTSVPILFNHMDNLMVIADKLDFPFQTPFAYVYKYIKHPNSIRATLVQLNSDMHNALTIANTATHRIQSIAQQVPTHVKAAVKFATSASDTMRKLMLPRTSESLSQVGVEIVDVTRSTLQRFFSVFDLLDEVIELSITTHASHIAVIPHIRTQKAPASVDLPYFQNNNNNIDSQYPAFTNVLTSAEKVYGEATQHITDSSASTVVDNESNLFGDNIDFSIDKIFASVSAVSWMYNKLKNLSPTIQNTKFKNVIRINEPHREQMRKIEKVHNRRIRQQFSKENELTKFIDEMAIFTSRALNSEGTMNPLLELVRQINSIREQWTKIIRFFAYLNMNTGHIQKIIAEQFIDILQYAVLTDYLNDPLDHEFFITLLDQGSEITNIAADSLVTLAKQYYITSSEHIVNQVVGFRQSLF
ncbi:hypothetical protein I4U23_022176 [Adineta vaga]|nr:hypothetical protein I4U23_022176 [Adineta vaga]